MLSQKQQKAIIALLTTSTREQAAKKAGISSRSLREYFQDPEFCREYRKAVSESLSEACSQVRQSLSPAIATLREILDKEDASDQVRVNAAEAIVRTTIKLTSAEVEVERPEIGSQAPSIAEYISPAYYALYGDILAGKHQYYNLPGGRGSGKSSFVSLVIVSGMMRDCTGECNAIVFRRIAATMRDSVYSQIQWAIELLGVEDSWKGSISPMCFTYLPTGSQIVFRGLDNPSKLKSIKPKQGYFRYVWFEEFSELPGENFTRNVMQSAIRGGENFTVFRSFNPPLSKSNWANQFIEIPDEKTVTLHTDYTQMPKEWLGESFLYEAERLKDVNPQAYLHEYMGQATGTGGEVFPAIEVREIPDAEINEIDYIYEGIDFGFAQDPSCFLRVGYNRKKETIFLLDEIYKHGLTNSELAELIKEKGYQYIIPGERMPIFCDCAEPKSIKDLQNAGLKAYPCKKFPGCVQYRVKWLQARKIVIDSRRTPNACKELTCYEYLRDKDGNLLSDLPDKDNHGCDALAYALDRVIYSRKNSA